MTNDTPGLAAFIRRHMMKGPIASYVITRGEESAIDEFSQEAAAGYETTEDLVNEIFAIAERDSRARAGSDIYFLNILHAGSERPTASFPMVFEPTAKARTLGEGEQLMAVITQSLVELHRVGLDHVRAATTAKDQRESRLERYEIAVHDMLRQSEEGRFTDQLRARKALMEDADVMRRALLDEDERKARGAMQRRTEALWQMAMKQVDILIPLFANYWMKGNGATTLAPFMADANLIFQFSKMLRSEQITKLMGALTPAQCVAIATLGSGDITLELLGPTLAKFAADLDEGQVRTIVCDVLDKGEWEKNDKGEQVRYKPSPQESVFVQILGRRDHTLLAMAERIIGTKLLGTGDGAPA